MTDKKPHFFRIELESTSWCPGQNLQFGHRENEFTKNWRSQEVKPPNPKTRLKEFINLQLIDFYNSIIEPETLSRSLAKLTTIPDVLKETLHGLSDALLANREFAFEFVRRAQFPHRPSRTHCIFLVPDSTESIKFWWNELQSQGKSKRKLFSVAASGITHRVNQDLLVPLRTCSIQEWESQAKVYWCDQVSESSQDEVLFAGDLHVISEMNIADFGLKND